MLSFFESLPKKFVVPEPLLLGSNGLNEILIEGFISRWRVISAISNLDEPYNPYLVTTRTLMAEHREQPLLASRVLWQEIKRGFPKLCLASNLGPCQGKIIRAHSIQKAAFKEFADNGHFYILDPLDALKGETAPKFIGVSDATTFTGLCEFHDQSIFSPIENEPFTGNHQQLFLHHYRAVAQSIYDREYKSQFLSAPLPLLQKPGEEIALREHLLQMSLIEADAREIANHKNEAEQAIKSKAWESLSAFVWIANAFPTIVGCEYFAPRKDFLGRIIQDTKRLSTLEWVSLTITASNGRALIILAGPHGSQLLAKMADSLRRVSRNEMGRIVTEYVFCHFGNFILLPKWWKNLPEWEKSKYIAAHTARFFPRRLKCVPDWGLKELI